MCSTAAVDTRRLYCTSRAAVFPRIYCYRVRFLVGENTDFTRSLNTAVQQQQNLVPEVPLLRACCRSIASYINGPFSPCFLMSLCLLRPPNLQVLCRLRYLVHTHMGLLRCVRPCVQSWLCNVHHAIHSQTAIEPPRSVGAANES